MKGENLDDRVASGELKEITPGVEEKPEVPETPDVIETPETPEVPETPETPPAENIEGENRRLKEKIRKMEEERENILSRPPERPAPIVHSVSSMSPYKPTDESQESEAYWSAREESEGVDRKVLYSQEQAALRAIEFARRTEKTTDDNSRAALDYALSKKPAASKYRAEIEAVLKPYSADMKCNAGSVMAVVEMVYGRKSLEAATPTPVKPPLKPIKPGSPTMTPRITSVHNTDKNKTVTLTIEQEKWAESLSLRAQGFTDNEILEKWEQKQKIFNPNKK